jgi:hypothetical protein
MINDEYQQILPHIIAADFIAGSSIRCAQIKNTFSAIEGRIAGRCR